VKKEKTHQVVSVDFADYPAMGSAWSELSKTSKNYGKNRWLSRKIDGIIADSGTLRPGRPNGR
jgi:hypothetical protein